MATVPRISTATAGSTAPTLPNCSPRGGWCADRATIRREVHGGAMGRREGEWEGGCEGGNGNGNGSGNGNGGEYEYENGNEYEYEYENGYENENENENENEYGYEYENENENGNEYEYEYENENGDEYEYENGNEYEYEYEYENENENEYENENERCGGRGSADRSPGRWGRWRGSPPAGSSLPSQRSRAQQIIRTRRVCGIVASSVCTVAASEGSTSRITQERSASDCRCSAWMLIPRAASMVCIRPSTPGTLRW
jgi:hypothetical protein